MGEPAVKRKWKPGKLRWTKRSEEIAKTRRECEEAIAKTEDINCVTRFLTRAGSFPNGVLLSAAVLRADMGVHNLVISSDELRKVAEILLMRRTGWKE